MKKKEGKVFSSLCFPDKEIVSINVLDSQNNDEILCSELKISNMNLENQEEALGFIHEKVEKPIQDKVDPPPKVEEKKINRVGVEDPFIVQPVNI